MEVVKVNRIDSLPDPYNAAYYPEEGLYVVKSAVGVFFVSKGVASYICTENAIEGIIVKQSGEKGGGMSEDFVLKLVAVAANKLNPKDL